MKYQEILIDNKEKNRYELWVEEKCSFIDYKLRGDHSVLLHTEVPEEIEGKGVATALVDKTFQYLEEQKMKAVPVCPYIFSYLKRHPKWNFIIAEKP